MIADVEVWHSSSTGQRPLWPTARAGCGGGCVATARTPLLTGYVPWRSLRAAMIRSRDRRAHADPLVRRVAVVVLRQREA